MQLNHTYGRTRERTLAANGYGYPVKVSLAGTATWLCLWLTRYFLNLYNVEKPENPVIKSEKQHEEPADVDSLVKLASAFFNGAKYGESIEALERASGVKPLSCEAARILRLAEKFQKRRA